MSDVNDFLSGGMPSAKFPTIGTVVRGTVVSSEMTQQTKLGTNELLFWKDGNPRMQAVITLQTTERDPEINNDDGRRRLYVKGDMQKAVATALKAVGAELEVGGSLAVQFTGEGKPDPGLNPPKLYTAQYKPPAAQPGDLFGAAPAQTVSAVPGAPAVQAAAQSTQLQPAAAAASTQPAAVDLLGD